ncbi:MULTISPECIES: phosphotransferase [unclassified Roseovarius]|uniref:phosphotransferase n=1 Tax=unclassified Roseovarius TaxID=2614913 RepID=UPI00273EAE80|nr:MULTISPECIES: choline/ethanolamine kinase family protein [unclassified Roseovarius]
MSEHTQRVMAQLRNLPSHASLDEAACEITRLGGLTNLVFRVDSADDSVIVRIPGDGTEEYIDRAIELANAEAAHRAGVSPEVLWADAATGVMITRTVPDITTMTPANFKSIDGAAGRAGAALAQLHGSGETFQFRFELFAMIDEYLKVLSTRDVSLPEGYHDVVKAAEPIKSALMANPAPLAPCHCDPLSENFLDDGRTMWIVDWEYSGMNDPLWDVGDLSVEAEMDAGQEAELLAGYFGRDPTAEEMGRVVIYKAMCDLLWTLWGLIQHADGNTAEDFWAYATGRFDRCRKLMNRADFDAHVAAVAAR